MYKNCGFTLIELLVVVLIIGILAAVALPMYTRAVEKSRAAKMISSIRALHDAQQIYYMANGKYAKSFEELDIDFGAPISSGSSQMKACNKGVAYFSPASEDAVRDGGDYEIAIGNIYGYFYSVAYRKTTCAAVFMVLVPRQGLQDTSAVYCVANEYVWAKKDWCHRAFGTDPNKDWVQVDFSAHVTKVPGY